MHTFQRNEKVIQWYKKALDKTSRNVDERISRCQKITIRPKFDRNYAFPQN